MPPTSTKTLKVPKPVTLFEKKFYWDELYDAVFYKPADLISRGLGRFFEQPVIGGSIGERARSAFRSRRR